MRFEHAEEFVAAGNRFAEQYASPGSVHHAFGASDERLQRMWSEDVVFSRVWQAQVHAQFTCPLGNLQGCLQKVAVRLLHASHIIRPLFAGDPVNLSSQLLHFFPQMFMLSPARHGVAHCHF